MYGKWSTREKFYHINCLELLAAFNGLKSFAVELTRCEIVLKIDNSTAIAYINKMGGTKYQQLNDVAYDIWARCELRRLWIFATYIPSKENTEADMASRVDNIYIEWEISPQALRKIWNRFGEMEVDLFATKKNSKCKYFCS